MTRYTPIRRFALLATAVLLAVACGPATPTATPVPSGTNEPTRPPAASPTASPTPLSSDAVDAIFDQIEEEVLAMRGLKRTEVPRQTIDEEALKAQTAKSFDEDHPPEYVAGTEQLYKALGLMPKDQSLKQLYLELLGSQVAGFYDPDKKELFVVSRTGTVNGADKITFAHEYDHALQDANFPVFTEQKDLLDQTDRAMARAAIYEGDATVLMVAWAGQNLTPEEFGDVQAAGTDPAAAEILSRTPQILVEGLLYPYTAGQAFVLPVQTSGGWKAVDALYDDMPRSTEQILHPDKYRAGEEPVAVVLPKTLAADMGKGWKESMQDTFGEFQLGAWLRLSGVRSGDASAAAAGWGGDRLAVLNGPDDAWAVVMRTTWDTADDARAFQLAAGTAVSDGADPGTVIADGRDITIIVASTGAVLDRAVIAAGYPGP